jgi:hypothetical protein
MATHAKRSMQIDSDESIGGRILQGIANIRTRLKLFSVLTKNMTDGRAMAAQFFRRA